MAKHDIDPATLHRLLVCDLGRGKLFWRERDAGEFRDESYADRWNKKYAGKEAFRTLAHNGYLQGIILYRILFAHRVVWAMAHGTWPDITDHMNGDRTDNRLVNLRSVSAHENLKNIGLRRDNSSGVVGVNWHAQSGRWRAAIQVCGKSIHLGCFDTIEEAAAARLAASEKHGFHPNHGREART